MSLSSVSHIKLLFLNLYKEKTFKLIFCIKYQNLIKTSRIVDNLRCFHLFHVVFGITLNVFQKLLYIKY